MEYMDAPEAEAVAKEIMETLPVIDGIEEASIKYIFILKKHSEYAAKIQKPGGVWKFLSDYDYVVLVHKPSWDKFSERQRKALIYHELLHITYKTDKNEKKHWKLRKHDIEEFIDVIREFGAWSPELNKLKEILES